MSTVFTIHFNQSASPTDTRILPVGLGFAKPKKKGGLYGGGLVLISTDRVTPSNLLKIL